MLGLILTVVGGLSVIGAVYTVLNEAVKALVFEWRKHHVSRN